MQGHWISPNQHNVVMHGGQPHNVAVVGDKDLEVVNKGGDHSIRGGTIAKKCYNPTTPTKDRLQQPLLRVNGRLTPIDWDSAWSIMAQVSKHVVKKHGRPAWAVKTYSYQYWENTYAITKLALRKMRTPAFAVHDQPTGSGSDTPGLSDAGVDPFSASYEYWGSADVLFISGTDPFETKTIIFNEWILPAMRRGMQTIWVMPRKTTGPAYAEKLGGLFLPIIPGTDPVLHMALARRIIEKGWEDSEFLGKYINNAAEHEQWAFQANGFEDFKKWILADEHAELGTASRITGLTVAQIEQAAEMLAKPKADGTRKKASFGLEKGNYWSNNYLGTASIASLGLICGAGNRPGQVISRFGGHQRGMMPGGRYPIEWVQEKFPYHKKKGLNLDNWVLEGKVRFAWVIGTTWIQAMAGSKPLRDHFERSTWLSEHQVERADVEHAVQVLKRRVDSGGMVVVNQDIYLVDPIGKRIADLVLPAATWGEEDFARANGERRIRLYSKFYDPPGQALPDWKIIAGFAKAMGFAGFNWKDSNQVFEEAAWYNKSRRTAYLPLVQYAKARGKRAHELLREYGTTGIQAPVRLEGGKLRGTKRLHDSTLNPGVRAHLAGSGMSWLTEFKTKTGRANLLKTPWKIFSDFHDDVAPRGDELWVTSGRINEFWQSGFDDQKRRPYLRKRWPANFIEIHPSDAARRGIESGDRVRAYSDRVARQVDQYTTESMREAVPDSAHLDDRIEHDPLLMAVVPPKERTRRNTSTHRPLSTAVEGDLLLGTFEDPIPEDVEAVDDAAWADPLLEDAALNLPWSDIEQLTYTKLKERGQIRTYSAEFEAVAIVTDAVRKGVAFTYFVLPESPANSLAPSVLDPISQRYRFKLGVGRLQKVGESPYKHDLMEMSFKSRTIV
jgi:arsenite oxidase large subunit